MPVIVTERFELVELKSFQKQPLSLGDNVGTVKALNPVLVNRHIPAELVVVSVKDVPVISLVIDRYSVGRVNRILFVADNCKLFELSNVSVPKVVITPVPAVGAAE